MPALAAVTLTEGGSRESSRRLWQEIVARSGPDEEWLRAQAEFRLRQLDALDQIAELQALVDRYRQDTQLAPGSWLDLVRGRYLAGIPADSGGRPFRLDPVTSVVSLDPESSLNPLPLPERPRS
jgi:hypothetical protein